MSLNAPVGPRPSSFSDRYLLAAVTAATLLVYLATLRFGFVYDDLGQIVSNPAIQSWSYWPQYFRANVWMQQTSVGNYYRPLFLTWLLLHFKIFGLHAFWWHLTAVLAHVGATALVFRLVLRLTRSPHVAAIATLLFGVHPAHVEAVAWISGIPESLLVLLLVPAFLAYMRYRDGQQRAKWIATALLLFVLALLVKETAIVFPVLIAGYELLFSRGALRDRVAMSARAAGPFAVLAVVYVVVRAAALGAIAHRLVNLPAHVGLWTLPSVLWFYIRHLLLPIQLSAFYDTPYVTHASWKFFFLPLLGIVLAAAAVAIAWWKSRSPLIPFGALWIFVPLLPLLDLSVLPMGDFVHDRYLYLPSIGLSLLLAIGLAHLDTVRLRLGTALALVLALAMGTWTVVQSRPWMDDVTLYAHGMKVAPNNDLPRNKLAATFVQRGMFEQGIRLYAFVLTVDPDYWYANYRMGYAQYMIGHYAEAERYLARAALLNRIGPVLYYLGLTTAKLRQFDAAEAALREAVRLEPRAPGYALALGLVLKQQGKLAPALEMFRAELTLNPADTAAQAQIAETSAQLRQPSAGRGLVR